MPEIFSYGEDVGREFYGEIFRKKDENILLWKENLIVILCLLI